MPDGVLVGKPGVALPGVPPVGEGVGLAPGGGVAAGVSAGSGVAGVAAGVPTVANGVTGGAVIALSLIHI